MAATGPEQAAEVVANSDHQLAAGIDGPIESARRSVKIAFLVCFTITAALALERVLTFENFFEAADKSREVAMIQNQILLSDEKLTISTNMAVMTGLPAWIERYRREVPVMKASIAEAMEIAPPDIAMALDSDTRFSNDVLVAMDWDALQFVEMGNAAAAREILESESYGELKDTLQRGVAAFGTKYQSRVDARLKMMKKLGIVIALSLVVFVGFVLVAFYQGLTHSLAVSTKVHQDARRKISTLATRDTLTGLLNRDAFLDDVNQLIRRDDITDVSVLLLDIDHFKPINERHGAAVADQVLVEIASRLRCLLKDGTPIARVGGDDFALALAHYTDRLPAIDIAAHIKEAIEIPMTIGGTAIDIGILAGVASYPGDGEDPTVIKRRAQIALNRAKTDRSPSVVKFESSMEYELNDQARVETQLRDAIASRQIVPYFQPIVNLRDGRPTSFEVLARWEHPTEGLIPPASFIPMAERVGQLDALFFLLLDQAAFTAVGWGSDVSIAVNVTPDQLTHHNLADRILDTLTRNGLDGSRLIVEVTEDAALSDVDQVAETIRQLKSRKVRIALDDFGTGYSSLQNLRALPFDHLKVDRSFVINLGTDPEAESIVQAVVGLGKALNIPVTAEGVESAGDAAHLRELGCDYAQGWHFGKPMPAADATRHLQITMAARDWSPTNDDTAVDPVASEAHGAASA